MSLLSSIILPVLEKQLVSVSPEIADFAIKQLGNMAAEFVTYVENKTNSQTVSSKESLGGDKS